MFDDALFQLLESDEFQNVFCRNCPKYRERLDYLKGEETSPVSDESSDEITIYIPPDPPCYVTDEPSVCLRWKAVTELCEKAHDLEKQCWRVAEDA